MTARSDRDLSPESIVSKVADASGSKYSGGPPTSAYAGKPPAPVQSKPAFTPTRVGGGGSFQSSGSRSRLESSRNENVDGDGWGADAPQVTRTQLEKVESAYKPTKVNMSELTSQKPEGSRYEASRPAVESNNSDVVKGAYQPVGKVDIAAIRRQAKESGSVRDERPTVVKGSYEPVGKVDIAAIRAKAQGPSQDNFAPARNARPTDQETAEPPKSLAERSSAFVSSERLTSLPKPKVSSKFGSSASTFTGTKAPAPAGLQSKPSAPSAPVGIASRTFADEGGKTPAQIWAEKKARERGNSEVGGQPSQAPTSPLQSQTSGQAGWKSSYSGKSWAPVQTTRTGQSASSNISAQNTGADEQEGAPTPPPGGVSAMRDQFRDVPPMRGSGGDSDAPTPPPMDLSSKPNAGAARGVPIPGMSARPQQPDRDEEEEESRAIPPPPAQRRSPTPPTPPAVRSSSPIRVAMPVGRGNEPTLQAPEERFSPPPVPVQSMSQAVSAHQEHLAPEPQVEEDDPARGAATAAAASTFGDTRVPDTGAGGKRALIQYDYEKAEDNELELREGEYVTNIEMVDEDWWMGQNSRGETGLFPSNYVELVDDDDGAAPAQEEAAPAPGRADPGPAQAQAAEDDANGHTATALYDYDAAEHNELSFPDGAKITSIVSLFTLQKGICLLSIS